MTPNALGTAAVAVGAILIGIGILLVIAAFIIRAIAETRSVPPVPVPNADFFDFMVELAKKLHVLYVPGFVMIGLGVFLIGIVVVGADPFVAADAADGGGNGAEASPSPRS